MEKERSVICPNCGTAVPVAVTSRLGRKPLNIGVKIICDALRSCHSVTLAAAELGCSRGYVYCALAKHGTTPKEVMATKQKEHIL